MRPIGWRCFQKLRAASGIGLALQRARRHRRVDDARHQRVDPDALRRVIDGDGLGEGGDRALGRDIGRVLAEARLRELRAHRDDGARPGGDHRLDGVVDPEIGALHVDREGAIPGRLAQRIDGAAERDAGGRHQHVDPAPRLHHPRHAVARRRRPWLTSAAMVIAFAALGLDIGSDLAQPDLVEIDERELRALRREQPCRGGADAGGGSRDDGDAILELHGTRSLACRTGPRSSRHLKTKIPNPGETP